MKIIKIKNFAIVLAAISLVLVQFGCEQDWQKELESSVLADANTAAVSVNSIEDSTATVNYTLSTVGRVFIAVVPGTDETATPDAQDILKLSVADAVFAEQIILNYADALTGSVNVPDLVQNTSYKVFALPVNADGVLGTVVTTDAFSTSDTYIPTLDLDAGISPAISSSAAQAIDFAITLTFNEPVVLATGFDIQLGYRNAVTGVIGWVAVHADSIAVSGNKITIKQMQELLNGQYVFLTIAPGAITDRSGNEFEGVTSGIVGTSRVGIFWRVAWEDRVELNVLPTDTVFVTNPAAFQVIKLVYPYKLSASSLVDYESSFIKVRYFDAEVSQDYNVDAGNIVIDLDTLEITIPRQANITEYVSISIAKGAVWDVYGNDVAAVEFGDYEWFVAYGEILGTYTASCASYYGSEYNADYNVTMFDNASTGATDDVIITGLFDSDMPIVGVLGSGTITIAQGQSFGDLMGDGGEVLIYRSGVTTPIDGTIDTDGNIQLDDWGGIISGGAAGYDGLDYDYYTTSAWTKTAKNQTIVKNPIPALKKHK